MIIARRSAGFRFLILFALIATTMTWAGTGSHLRPARLRCDFSVDPIGVDSPSPGLSWTLESDGRNERQTAYRILAASTRPILDQGRGDLWDSGKVASDEQIAVAYGGRPLRSFKRVYWKIRVWDGRGEESAWSEPAAWTMGVLRLPEWRAQWIGAPAAIPPSPDSLLLRRGFPVRPGLVRAEVFVCGLGQYEMTINGRRVGDALLAPGWTKYDKTRLYDGYDIRGHLKPGLNAAGILLGNGFFNVRGGRYTKYKGSFGPLQAVALIRLEYANGTVEFIGTNASWRVLAGPLTFSCVYGGEDFDARREPRGWNEPAFDDSAWQQAGLIPRPEAVLRGSSFAAPPVQEFEALAARPMRDLTPGKCVYDLGQNAPVMVRLRSRGPAGSSVRIAPAELLHADGRIDRRSSGGGEAYWRYILSGKGEETYFSKFYYSGCRYLEVERLAAEPGGGALPEVLSLEGIVVHTASEPAGEFACSYELFNRIRTLIRWAQRANLMSLITDCPHREKLGWLEQYHLNGPSLRYEWDLARLFAKTMGDMADSQLPDGLVPDIAPEYTVFRGGFRDSPEWGAAFVLVPWQQYEWTGDIGLLRRHYEGMKRYADYLESKARGGIVSHGLGDWYDLGPKPPGEAQLTPKALTATAFHYLVTRTISLTAALLGRQQDAKIYAARAESIKTAFNAAFFDPVKGLYATGSQTADAIPLVMGLVPAGCRSDVLAAIVKDVRLKGNALTAGDVGYRYLLRALADGGRSDVIFDMNSRADKPGYGYQLEKGATSLAEAWDAGPDSSQNHFMLGHIEEWFYHDLAGIGGDPEGPGFKRIVIAPNPVGDLT